MRPVFHTHHYVGMIKYPGSNVAEGAEPEFMRHLLGLEHLFGMSYPPDIDVSSVKDTAIREIAGNSAHH